MKLATTTAIHSRLGTIPAGTVLTLAPDAISRYRTALRHGAFQMSAIDVEHPLHDGAYMGVNLFVFAADDRRAILDAAVQS